VVPSTLGFWLSPRRRHHHATSIIARDSPDSVIFCFVHCLKVVRHACFVPGVAFFVGTSHRP